MRFLFILFFVSWTHLYAQSSRSLTIWTLDEADQPVENVTVTIAGLSGHEISSSSGQCKFVDLPATIRGGTKINLIVERDGWMVADIKSLTFVIPNNLIENPIKIRLKKLTGTNDMIEVISVEEFIEESAPGARKISRQIETYDDEKYSTNILVEAKFKTESFNTSTYLNGLELYSRKDAASHDAKVDIATVSIDNSIKWMVNLKSAEPLNKSKNLRLNIGNRVFNLALKNISWRVQKKSSSGREVNEWFLAQALATIVLDDPDWISINSARFIKLRNKNESVLEVIVENHSNRAIGLTYLQIEAVHNWGKSCHTGTGHNPWQEVRLDWNEIIASNGNGAWTEINNQEIAVKTNFKPASCSDYMHRLEIAIPLQMDLDPKAVVRLSYKISENSFQSQSVTYDLPASISDWGGVSISLQPDEFIRPKIVDVRN